MLPVGLQKRFEGGLDREVPLGPLTTWRIGGPAEFFLEPASVEELAETLRTLWRIGLPYRVLGGGSNLLIADRGVRGAVVSLARLGAIRLEAGGLLVAEAGALLHRIVRQAASAGLRGTEWLAGIPGRVGGAIFGNAGGRHGDIGSLVCALDLLERDGSEVRLVPAEGFFRYRGSGIGDRIVVRAHLGLDTDLPAAVRRRSLAVIRERRTSQPGWTGNAGCVFKNPPGASAGQLIDSAGCKGLREGGVVVSARHANFIENESGGCAAEVERLLERVCDRVRAVHGVELAVEVQRWS